MTARILMAASGGILLVLGVLHLIFTFRGSKLRPRDPALVVSMSQVSPGITRQTTMWKTWIGFNASHSMGLILFGLVYGYLSLFREDVLFSSAFLLGLGLAMLGSYVVLGKLYWFSVPFRSCCVAFVCYLASILLSLVTPR